MGIQNAWMGLVTEIISFKSVLRAPWSLEHISEILSNCKDLLISVSFQLLPVNFSSYFCVELGPAVPLAWCVDVQGVFVC